MAQGLTGTELADGLHPVVSALAPEERRQLAHRISREYMILGHAAHDPNLYKTCRAAKEAKDKSDNPHLKILTYKTPMCGSCGLNRQGSCSLMGGKLIDGPHSIPERAVHSTADMLVASQQMDEGEVREIEMGPESPTARMAYLHERRIRASRYVDDPPDQDIRAYNQSRRAASILEPGESFDATPLKEFRGSGRRLNAESTDVGVIDDTDDSASDDVDRFSSMLDDEMDIDVPADLPRERSSQIDMDSYTETDVPAREKRSSRQASSDTDVQNDVQSMLFKVARAASHLLSEGAMTTRRASTIYSKMDELLDHGARHTDKTARIHRQLNSLGGGMEM
jgi:hypothetical protein